MMKAALRMYLIKGKKGGLLPFLLLHAHVISAEGNHYSVIRVK